MAGLDQEDCCMRTRVGAGVCFSALIRAWSDCCESEIAASASGENLYREEVPD